MALRLGAGAARLCVAASRQATQSAGLRVSATAGREVSEVPQYLKSKMKHFQLPNGLPVHVKGGPMDTLLYYFTALCCTVGLLECCRVYYVLSYPQAPKE